VSAQVEFMVHRRLLKDDGRGLSEALNETSCTRGKHWIFFSGLLFSSTFFFGNLFAMKMLFNLIFLTKTSLKIILFLVATKFGVPSRIFTFAVFRFRIPVFAPDHRTRYVLQTIPGNIGG